MTATFRVLLKAQIRPGTTVEFERSWVQASDAVSGHPANRGHWLARSDDDANTYYVISDWTDEPSFREFESSEAHLTHRTMMRPYLTGGSMATMRLVAGGARVPV